MKTTKRSKKNKNKKFAAFLALVPLFALICNVIFNTYNTVENQKSMIATTTNLKSISYKSNETILTDKSKVDIIFYDEFETDSFYSGACFNIAFTNRTNYDRLIKKVTVSATDIEPNNLPNIEFEQRVQDNIVSVFLRNKGWGKASKIEIKLREISDTRISMKNNNSAIVQNIHPGESKTQHIFSFDDLEIKNVTDSINVSFYYYIIVDGITLDDELIFNLEIDNNSINDIGGWGFGDDNKKYAIIIDASKKGKVNDSYSVQQILPASQVTILPIYILPTQSCNLSLKLTFTMEDGEKIVLPVIQNKDFVIPYNTNIYEFSINTLEDHIQSSDRVDLYFPFAISQQYTNSEFIEQLKERE